MLSCLRSASGSTAEALCSSFVDIHNQKFISNGKAERTNNLNVSTLDCFKGFMCEYNYSTMLYLIVPCHDYERGTPAFPIHKEQNFIISVFTVYIFGRSKTK